MTIIESHNLFRKMEGLSSLEESEPLTKLANNHAKRMARRLWLNSYGLTFKNIVAIGNNVDIVIRQIINQPETREIMFGDYTFIGCGSFTSRRGITYWTILYL